MRPSRALHSFGMAQGAQAAQAEWQWKDQTRGKARTDVTCNTLVDLLDLGSCSIHAHLSAA